MKRVVSMVLAVAILVGMLPTTAWATEMETVGGTCGENLSWTFDESSGSLKISGTGDMDDYSWSQMYDPTSESSDIWVTDAPWRDYYNAIKSIVIESDVTSIGDGAFRGCSAVTSISLSNDVEALGEYSFMDCDGIIDIVIPENVKTIGEAAFSDCNALESVSILGAASIGNFAFSECANLISVELPDTLTSIGEYGFRGCEALRTVTIPSSVRTIGTFAFVWCESLNEICFEGSAPSMDGTILSGLTCNVSYPSDDETWSEELQKEFDDTITWNGNSSDEGTSGSSHSHSYGDWYETKAPTQEAEGEERRDCIDCDYYETRITEKLPVDEEPGNSCGENLTWELDTATGTLVISGTGTMDNSWWPYETPSESPNFAPWHDNAANIKSVVINSGVTSIGHFAFFDCVNLTNVSIPEGVTFIGCAFVGCDSLEELYIPASVTDFRYPSNEGVCTGLTKIVVDVSNSVYSSDEAGMLYNKDKTKFIGCPTGYQGAYTIADSVIEIGDWAFYACTGLTSVDVPTSVTTIGISAFNSCAKLDGIVIPDGVTAIGMFTFAYCAGLTEITIPKNVTALGNGVFTECTALAEVRFEGDAPDIDYECFNQTSTTAYYPAGNSTWTEDKLSNYCGNIQWVEYADNVNQCGDELFWEFDSDTKTLTISGKGEMYDFPDAGSPWYSLNAEIDHVVISEGATSIGNYAFVSCGVDDIEIPDSVTRIGQGAFALSSIESIKIPSGVTTIEEYTFTRSSLYSVELPEQLKVIEENAFAETPLTTVTLPETLTEIGAEAFWSTMLTSVAIPENVSLIGAGAFAWCEDLTSISVVASNANFVAKNGVLFDKNETTLIQYPAKKTQETYTVPAGMSVISAYAFSGAKALKKVVLSDNMKSLEKCAFIGCSGLTEMNIPENVSSFGLGLFDNCRDLKNITFTGDAPVFAEHWISEEMDLTAYYPADDETWTDEVKQNYGGKITWVVSCDHNFGDWYETKAPTEEEEGEERRDCEKCDHYETRTKEKLCQTHNYVSVITEPTCTKQGYTTYTCDCGYSYVDNYIEPLGHNMSEWYEHTKPTNGERGEDRRNCENCTYYESRSVPSLSTTLIDSGECGKDLQWRFTSDGVLSIVGTGSMRAWEPTVINPNGKAPWNKYTSEIRTLEIGSGVISIGSYAFYACKNLSVIKIPATLKAIGKNAFGSGARNLYITDLTAWCKIDFESRGSAPMQTYGGYLYINGEKTEELVIPDGITEIGNFSFSGMNFKSIKIPEGVSIIGGYAFAGNDRNMTLTSVELPESLRVIKGWAFSENRNLESISLPAKLSTIDENALCDTGISNITIPGSVNTISASAFSSCDNLESVVILDGVSSIEEEAFAFSDKLKDVVIPSSVTSIASDAFSFCKSLTKIELSNDNSSFTLKDGAVFSKNFGKLIIFPAMHNTSSFAIPDVTTTIADYAFQNSNNLKEVIIPDSITSIGTYAFSYSQNLASVTIPGTIEEIQYCTFAYSPGLIDVKIKSGIHTIGNWAFRECTNLRTVTIPRSVESIRDYAFYDCNSLSDVYYMGSEEEWGEIYIGSRNSCLLNANIHFNCEGPELEKNAEIRYFRKWDADTQTAYWGEEPPIVEGMDLGSQVTEETDTSFLADVDSLVGTYVLVETKPRDDGMIAADILLSIKPLETKTGTVTAIGFTTITIDGVEYSIPENVNVYDLNVGDSVMYHLYNGDLVGINGKGSADDNNDDSAENIGTVRYYSVWDVNNNVAQFGPNDHKGLQVTDETDTAFTSDPTKYLDQYVLVESKPGGEGADRDILISMKAVETKSGLVSSSNDSAIIVDGNSYNVLENLENPKGYVNQHIVYHLYEGNIVGIEILQTKEGFITYWDKANKTLNIKENADDELPTIYYLSPVSDVNEDYFLGESGSRKGQIQYRCDSCNIIYHMEYDNDYIAVGEFSYLTSDNNISIYKYTYNEDCFHNSSDDYQHELTKMSLRVTMAAGDVRVAGKADGAENIKDLMDKLGFNYSDDSIYYPDPTYDSIGYAMGSKQLVSSDGEKSTLIMIAVRGSGYGNEWGGNFRLGVGTDHEGFRRAADRVIEGLEEYIQKNDSVFHPRVKVWISGFSRAAATTNLVAAYLDDGNIERIDREDVFAFCFECPQNTTNSNANNSRYRNIVNIINPLDLVTKVAMSAWDFTRYGNNYYLPSQETLTPQDYSNKKYQMMEEYEKISEYGSTGGDIDELTAEVQGQASALDDLTDILAATLKSRLEYHLVHENNFIVALAELFANGMSGNDMNLLKVIQAVPNLQSLLKPALINFTLNNGDLSAVNFNAHEMPLCLAWLDSINGIYADTCYRKIFVNCPVDVEVYQGETLVGKIANDVPVVIPNGIVTYVDSSGQKVIVLPVTSEYLIRLLATDSGNMTYTVTEYNMDSARTERVVSYYDVELTKGDCLNGTVEALNAVGKAKYPLALSDGQEAKPTIDQSAAEVKTFDVNVAVQAGGTAYGDGRYLNGEFAKVTAVANEGYQFVGWFVDGEKISTEAEYRFAVTGDMTITAQFTLSGHIDHVAGAEWISDGTYHWHTCTGCDEQLDVSPHSGGTATCTKKAVCAVCGTSYGELASHDYETSWSQGDANGHWHECKNCSAHDTQIKHTPGAAATSTTAQTCTVCGYVITPALGHTCTAGTKWYSNGTYHWHLCTSCGAWVKTSYHSYSGDTDETCNVCGYVRTVTATEPTEETEVAMTEATEATVSDEEVIAIETAPMTVSTEANENFSDDAVSENTDSHGVSSVLITVFAIVALGSLAALAILLVYKKRRKSE